MADMVVSAGVDAAADVDANRSQLFLQVQVGQPSGQGLGDGDRAGVRQAAVVQPRAGDDVCRQVCVGRGQTGRVQRTPDVRQVVQANMGQDQVLFIGGPHLVKREPFGQVGDYLHLGGGDVARHAADRLQRDDGAGVSRLAMTAHIVAVPAGEIGFGQKRAIPGRTAPVQRLEGRRGEIGPDALQFGLGQAQVIALQRGEMALHLLPEGVDAHRLDEDLDPRLMDIVAPTQQIIRPQDGGQIGQQVPPRNRRCDLLGDMRQPALATADEDPECGLTVGTPHDLQAHIMGADSSAVPRGPGHRDLEFARQEGKFGMDRRPLPQDFAPGAGILDLVPCGPGEDVGGDVSYAVARGLDGMHLDLCQLFQNVGKISQGRPVVLNIGPRREMAVALVIDPGDVGQPTHLATVHDAIGHRHPQHIGMQLQVDAVHQPQGLELILGQGTRNPPVDLIAELLDTIAHQVSVEFVITVHQRASRLWPTVGPAARIDSLSRSRPDGRPSSTSMR